MGDSDKLADSGPGSYRFVEHRRYLDGLLEALDVREKVTLGPRVQLGLAGPPGRPVPTAGRLPKPVAVHTRGIRTDVSPARHPVHLEGSPRRTRDAGWDSDLR
jgi:hypothetical protein